MFRETTKIVKPNWGWVPIRDKSCQGPRSRIPPEVHDAPIPFTSPDPAGAASAASTDPQMATLVASPAVLDRVAAPAGSPLPLPRLLIVFAHPDDEVLAMGARLERLAQAQLFTVTDGAPADGRDAHQHGFQTLDAYRAGRRQELADALLLAGISLPALLPSHPPFHFPVADQTAALHLAPLTRAIAQTIEAFAPEAILTHPYEGGHPDHDACAFAVHTALRWRRHVSPPAARNAAIPEPVLLEAPSYHAGNDGSMQTGAFLDLPPSPPPAVRALSPQEKAHKQQRLACFASQAETLAQFGTKRELFRVAPRYDFSQPPHPGQLLYEGFAWGMTGERFRELAAAATDELFAASGATR